MLEWIAYLGGGYFAFSAVGWAVWKVRNAVKSRFADIEDLKRRVKLLESARIMSAANRMDHTQMTIHLEENELEYDEAPDWSDDYRKTQVFAPRRDPRLRR